MDPLWLLLIVPGVIAVTAAATMLWVGDRMFRNF